MHILFFSHYFPPEVNAPATRTYEHCRRWVEAGHRVTVVTCAPNCPDGVVYDGYRNRLAQREAVDGIEVLRVWTYVAANKGFLRRIANYVSYMIAASVAALFVARPDVIVATTPQFFCGWAGAIASFVRWAPFVLEVRDLWPDSIAAVGAIRSRALLWLLGVLERWLYRLARRIVTVGDGYRASLVGKGVRAEKIAVIMNGVSSEWLATRPRADGLARRLGLDGKFVCSYVGTVGMAHALEVVLDAAERLRDREDIAFLIVGDGARREALEEERDRRGLTNVAFAGRQPHALIPDYLTITDASLIHLRRTELFRTVVPSKMFEAMAMGRPIILGVEGDAAAILSRARAGIPVPPEDAEALAKAVTHLRDHPATARELGANGQAHVKVAFDRRELADRYLSILRDILGRDAETTVALEGAGR